VARVAALPLIVGGVALQRTAGSFAATVSGQSKTPFLNIPFATPTIGSLPARRSGGSYGRPSPRLSKSRRESGSVDRQCEAQHNFDLGQCSQDAARYGTTSQDRRTIYKICEGTPAERHAECRAGGGINFIRTPLYSGKHFRGG
jgi:hypothetical protein